MKVWKPILVLLCFPLALRAQNHFRTETEVGMDGTGKRYFSQYFFYDRTSEGHVLGISSLARYTEVQDGVNRGEFAMGPKFQFKKATVNTYFGGTTEGRVMLTASAVLALPGRFTFVGISDPKFTFLRQYSHGVKQNSTWFRKVFLGRGHYQFRWEDLYVANVGETFGHVGPEFRLFPTKITQIYANPFYDYVNRRAGFYGGVRLAIH